MGAPAGGSVGLGPAGTKEGSVIRNSFYLLLQLFLLLMEGIIGIIYFIISQFLNLYSYVFKLTKNGVIAYSIMYKCYYSHLLFYILKFEIVLF